MAFENLLKPIQIGKLKLGNRIVMTAMATNLADAEGNVTQDIVEYFRARARGGTGLIYTEFTRIDKDGPGALNELGAYTLKQANGLRKIAEAVHQFDSKIFLQLHHAGSMTKADITKKQPIAPSAVTMPGNIEPREMTVEEIKDIIGKFIQGAKIATMAGFDGVEIHCAHGYLLHQFLSPFLNRRTDEYGGSTENRFRIVKEIMEGIRKIAPNLPISVRISADDLIASDSKTLKLDEAKEIAKMIESCGASILNVSAGGGLAPQGVIAPALWDEGWLIHLAEGVKSVVNIPVIGVSLIRDFNYADSLIADGKCDMVAMARPHFADPALTAKLKAGCPEQIRPCIVCMNCAGSIGKGRTECAVNPVMGYEHYFKSYNKNGAGRKAVVIGGGPAGCEAARVLAIRGFNVTLFEKEEKLGGQLNVAKLPPHKYRIDWLITFYENEMKRLGVDVKLSTPATVEAVKALDPYAVILATGGKDFIPPFVEIESSLVCTANDLITGKVGLAQGQKAVIVGSGMTGMETAHKLLDEGIDTAVVEMLPDIGMSSPGPNMIYIKRWLSRYDNLELTAGVKVLSVKNNIVTLEKVATGEKYTMPSDCTIFASGVKSVCDLEDALKAEFNNVHVIGDARQIGQIASAVREGFTYAWHIDDGCDVYD